MWEQFLTEPINIHEEQTGNKDGAVDFKPPVYKFPEFIKSSKGDNQGTYYIHKKKQEGSFDMKYRVCYNIYDKGYSFYQV